jgi:hypothetical protein
MRTYLLRIALALLTFVSGAGSASLYRVLNPTVTGPPYAVVPGYRFVAPKLNDTKQTPGISLPVALESTLDQKFPGWHYQSVDPEITSYLRANISPDARPDLISGDFDGNGLADFAALIEHQSNDNPEPAAQTSFSLVIFLRSAGGFKMQVLEPLGDYLVLMKRGEQDYDFEAQQYFNYPHDSIFMGIWDKAGSSYIFEKGRFRAITTSD